MVGMHYDVDKGVKIDGGLFTLRSIIVMLTLLILACIYTIFCFLAPEIFPPTAEQKEHIYVTANTEEPTETDYLRIPGVGIEVEVSNKNSAGIVYQMSGGNDDRITLISEFKKIGITPWETLRLSPLFRLKEVQIDDMIYLDIGGKRFVYKVNGVNQQLPADLEIQAIETIQKLDNNVIIRVSAKKIGELKIIDGKAEILNITKDLDVRTD